MRRSPMAAARSRPTWSSASAPRPARRSTSARRTISAAIIEPRYVAMMNAMMRETVRVGTAHKAPAAGLAGRRQDRHQPGFPRRLVRRLHRPSRHRRLARQRRFLADAPRHRRRPAGRIWARFMRAAHQGVAVAALPGQSAPPTLASIVQQAVNRSAPPANVGSLQRAPQRPQQPSGGLDGWLIDTAVRPDAERAGRDRLGDRLPRHRTHCRGSHRARCAVSRGGTQSRSACALSGMTRWPPSISSSANAPPR